MKIKDLTIAELNDLIKSSDIICKIYENSIKLYDGTINTNAVEYKDFNLLNEIRGKLLKEVEKRLKKLE